jgi:hypothetical protein
MLTLIPYEICKNIPSIKAYLNQQNFQPIQTQSKD